MTSFNDEYLAHYGVLGMKWGVRKYQNESGSLTAEGKKRYANEYSKATKHLVSLKTKAEKGAALDTTRARAKVTRLASKGAKIEKKAAKASKKEAKLASKLADSGWKNQKQIDKYIKYKKQAAKLQTKGAKYMAKSAKLNAKISEGLAQSEKYTKKGSKFYDEMLKSFGDMPVSMFNPKDVATVASIGKQYGK